MKSSRLRIPLAVKIYSTLLIVMLCYSVIGLTIIEGDEIQEQLFEDDITNIRTVIVTDQLTPAYFDQASQLVDTIKFEKWLRNDGWRYHIYYSVKPGARYSSDFIGDQIIDKKSWDEMIGIIREYQLLQWKPVCGVGTSTFIERGLVIQGNKLSNTQVWRCPLQNGEGVIKLSEKLRTFVNQHILHQ